MVRKLLALIMVSVTVAGPASAAASAMGAPAGVVSSWELRSHDAEPADSSASGVWRAGAVVAVAIIILGTFAFTLWSERQGPDDGSSEGGGGSRGHPDGPRSPTGPGAEDLHWSLFEAEFWDYVRSRESTHPRSPAVLSEGRPSRGELSVRREPRGDAIVLWLTGTLDQATSALLERELDAQAVHSQRVLLDVAGLRSVDAHGLDALVWARRQARASDPAA